MKQCYPIFLFAFLLLFSVQLVAQQEVNYTLYRYHMNLINPAMAGTQGAPFTNIGFRNQWLGIDDSPRSFSLSYSSPHKNERVGLGFSVTSDKTFVEQQTQLFADFSYRLPLGGEKNVFLGLKAGGTSFRLQAADLRTLQSNLADPNLLNTSSFVPNIGVGAVYHSPGFYFALSIPRLLSTERFREENGQETRPTDRPHFYAATGLRFEVVDRFEFTPSLLYSYVNAAPSQLVIDATFSYDKKVDFGAQYIQRGGIGGTLNVNIANDFQIGYAYTTQLGNRENYFSQGTHEVLLRIRLGRSPFVDDEAGGIADQDFALNHKENRKERRVGTKNKGIRSGLRF